MKSYQNLILLQNLYRLKATGFEYIDPFSINEKTAHSIPSSLEELAKSLAQCHLCDLSKSRTQCMSGFGDQNSSLMVVDYDVSQAQDTQNNYFAGRAGESLKNMIEKVLLLPLSSVYITHLVKCKTLKTNKPSPSEVNSCKAYFFSQLEFVQPKVIVTLGEEAYATLTQDHDNFENVRGHVIDFQGYKLVPLYHPSYLLRNPELKKATLADLKTVQSSLAKSGSLDG